MQIEVFFLKRYVWVERIFTCTWIWFNTKQVLMINFWIRLCMILYETVRLPIHDNLSSYTYAISLHVGVWHNWISNAITCMIRTETRGCPENGCREPDYRLLGWRSPFLHRKKTHQINFNFCFHNWLKPPYLVQYVVHSVPDIVVSINCGIKNWFDVSFFSCAGWFSCALNDPISTQPAVTKLGYIHDAVTRELD